MEITWEATLHTGSSKIEIVLRVLFLAADTQLYQRLCPFCPLVRWSMMIELKSAKTRIFEQAGGRMSDSEQ